LKEWPSDPLVIQDLKPEVSEKLPHGLNSKGNQEKQQKRDDMYTRNRRRRSEAVMDCRDGYFVPLPLPFDSPVQKWTDAGCPINAMGQECIAEVVEYWLDKGDTDGIFTIYDGDDVGDTQGVPVYYDLATAPYDNAYPWVRIPKSMRQNWEFDPWGQDKTKCVSVKRHEVVWRHQNDFAAIPSGLVVSHTHHDQRVLRLVAETPSLCASRGCCHQYQWYNPDQTGTITCPHRMYWPCT